MFRYFDVVDTVEDFGFWNDLPQVQRWRQALAARTSVQRAVGPQYPALLRSFLLQRGSALSRKMS